jgi:hypothetical protein
VITHFFNFLLFQPSCSNKRPFYHKYLKSDTDLTNAEHKLIMAIVTCSGTVVHHRDSISHKLVSRNTLIHRGKVGIVKFFNPVTK